MEGERWLRRITTLTIAVLTAVLMFGDARAQAVSNGFRVIGEEEGVLISVRSAAGDPHPTYRGQATIHGSVLHVLAVVLDTLRSTRWVKGSDEMEILDDKGRVQLVHMSTHLPWPIRDRDMIMQRSIDVLSPATEFRVRFVCAPKKLPEQHGKLRVTQCDSHFTLKAVDTDKTYVDYQVKLDPGGGLPHWAIRWMEKRITVETLTKLQRQVARTRGKYEDVMRHWTNAR
jgi:hypothetical protein